MGIETEWGVNALALIFAGVSLFIWIVLTFFRGAFWQILAFDDDISKQESLERWPRVVTIVPARDEAGTIARTVESLAKQEYPGELRVVIVDDHSEDGTGKLAQEAAGRAGACERVLILQGAALENGWTGKLLAMRQGVESSAAREAEYFWFTDADIEHAPDTLRRVVQRAERNKLDLVSLMALSQVNSFPERVLIPPFLYFFLKLYPPSWTASRKRKTAGAAGGCILLRRAALERIGGLGAIRGEVIDDCTLAKAVKRSGGGIWLGLTRKSVSLRTYASFTEIQDLIARTAFTQLGYSGLLLAGTLLGMSITYLLPVICTFSAQPLVWRLGLAAWALMAITYLPTVRFYRMSPLWAATLPVAAAFYTYATWVSAMRYWLGRGGQWKGRAQAPAKSSAQ
ncbi:MAG TPA: glycosyltransferase [Candidatus Limnocylindrales bacterium]|nr:glycosyltransferase [Candidatus Limnocylindrales bacterium]